jgi:hypothetical protein
MNIIPRKEINRSLELIDFRFNSRTRTIPEPDSFGYCSPIPMGISGAQPDYGTGGYCVPPPSVSDLYEETKEALRDLAKAYSESSKDISKYYSESSDDMGYLSYVLKKKGYNKYVYGEHKGAVSTGGSIYPCEEHCYKCCSKWECDETGVAMEIMNKYGLDIGVHCFLCSLELIAFGHSVITGQLIRVTTTAATVGCGLCGFTLVEAAGYRAAKCCIGEWYDCNCHCVNIKWG